MKSSKKKRNFIDLSDFNSKKNKTNQENNYNTFKNIKSHEEYETPLQTLVKLFPDLSYDLIQGIYEENDRTFVKAKIVMDELCKNPNEVDQDFTQTYANEEKQIANIDINSLTSFKIDDPFIENLPLNNTKNVSEFKKKKIDLNKLNIDEIFPVQKKNSNEYVSVFSSLADEVTPKNENFGMKDEYYLESLTLDFYCDSLIEFFPNLSRIEIVQKICDNDFDIDKIIISIFEGSESSNFDYSQIECQDISKDFKEEVLSNFYSGDCISNVQLDLNHFNNTIFNHNVQQLIEKKIKKENLTSKFPSNYTEKDFPSLADKGNEDNISKTSSQEEEYFLDKDIKDIKTKCIREDLQKLSKIFAFTDDFVLKWVYYQYMDYGETYKYFKKNATSKGIFDKYSKIDVKDKNPVVETSIYCEKKQDKNNEHFFLKIISEKPSKWSIETRCKNINLDEYQSIRRKLIRQAQIAWRSGRPQDAKIIMAKARRYKQDINTLLINRKIKLFSQNNENIENIFDYHHNFLDLHGLNLEESKLVINKKFSDIKQARLRGDLDPSKKFPFHIVTGVGHHSTNQKSVLFPKLLDYLKDINLPLKSDNSRGSFIVYL
jgi:hypothetical protein